MPLFGIRKSKENQQSQTQGTAGDAKAAVAKTRVSKKAVTPAKAVVAGEKKAVAMPKGSFSSATDNILRPHITEKSGIMSQNGVYTFQVARGANKPEIAKAVKALYKVSPVKITVINVPAKNVFVRGKWGSVAGMRKAIITVKKGEKIDFV